MMPAVGEGLGAGDRRPRIVVVDDDPGDLALLENEIGSRYARDYLVVARSSPVEALAVLEGLHAADQRVADLSGLLVFQKTSAGRLGPTRMVRS